jgi:hypothetical protein
LQIGEAERFAATAADQKERIVRHHLAEAHERRKRVLIVRLHHPHRPTPGQIDAAVEELRHGIARRIRRQKLDVHAFAFVKAERMGRVVRRIEHRAKVLHEPDRHERDLVVRPEWRWPDGRDRLKLAAAGSVRRGIAA